MRKTSTKYGKSFEWERARGMITAFGESKTLAAWSNDPRCTVKRALLRTRLALGWDPGDAITRPKRDAAPRLFTHEGRTLTLRGWAEQSGIKYNTLVIRTTRSRMTLAQALAKGPDGPNFRLEVTAFGETKSVSRWAVDDRANCGAVTLRKRLRDGWDPEQAITAQPQVDRRLGTGVPYTAFGMRMGLEDWARRAHIPRTIIQSRMDHHGLTLEAALRSLGWVPHDPDVVELDLLQIHADDLQPGDNIIARIQDTDPDHPCFTVRRTTNPADDPS
ncbi:hypothetical protein [Nocardia terpenica]|uniref:Uncharacterized protein n=1 Tax=Nocardia terpenica TaxID=455432 RepID=A0A164JCH1_9NOCA|nr:hypothetical protein [Nocardia terpenica]KZM70269.1 hypothetical protein AWN90_06915 [Nocardia terpenica]NQE91711.1 hypothetical protein [Nocardia terpenica]